MRLTTKIGENFAVDIEFSVDDGQVDEMTVFSSATGQDLSDLIFDTQVWQDAWNCAQQSISHQGRLSQQRYIRETCFDTPYA